MGKVSQNSANYMIKAKLSSSGIIEKSDVVGAVFGQTEGLLGEDLDLRELRNKGKVGRIEVDLEKNSGSTEGTIEIATSLDATDTSILAASLETIEKIGPTRADIRVEEVSDVRSSKRDYIVKRSKQILKDIRSENPDMNKIKEEVKHEVRESEIVNFRGFPAGPDIYFSDEIILVEGQADVKNLVKHGVKNALALGGTSVPERIPEITEDKEEVTAFLDGDRGGDLILEELRDQMELDYVVRAPEGLEVEELDERQTFEALRDKEDSKYVEETGSEAEDIPEEVAGELEALMQDLVATRALNIVNEDYEVVDRMPVDRKSEVESEEAFAVLADDNVDSEMVELAEKLDAEYAVGRDKTATVNSSEVRILTEDEL